jgi:hypothetical protein
MTKPTYSIDAPDQAKLKIARTEIEAILAKHDLAGVAVLHTPGMSEFFHHIQPSYSCAWIDDSVPMLRVKSKLADYGGDRARRLHDQAATANMFAAISNQLGHAALMFLDCSTVVDKTLNAQHKDGERVSDPNEKRRQ